MPSIFRACMRELISLTPSCRKLSLSLPCRKLTTLLARGIHNATDVILLCIEEKHLSAYVNYGCSCTAATLLQAG